MAALECPLCHGTVFKKEEGYLHSKWRMNDQFVRIMICEKCKFIMLFSEGKSIWDIG